MPSMFCPTANADSFTASSVDHWFTCKKRDSRLNLQTAMSHQDEKHENQLVTALQRRAGSCLDTIVRHFFWATHHFFAPSRHPVVHRFC